MNRKFTFENVHSEENKAKGDDAKNTVLSSSESESSSTIPSFNSESELKEILKLPKEEREQALADWKEKFTTQRIELATMQADLITYIRKNPDATKEELLTILDSSTKEHGFTEKQMTIARTALDIYEEKHQIVLNIREKYPDDRELFQAVFGVKPWGKVHVETGPITLNFSCNNPIDFARIYHFDESTSAVLWTLAKRMVGGGTRGVHFRGSNPFLPEIKGILIAEDASSKDKEIGDIVRHEEQHAFRALFYESMQRVAIMNGAGKNESQLAPKEDEKIKAEVLQRSKRHIEMRIEDELLAFMKGGASDNKIMELMGEYYINNFLHREISLLQRDLDDAEEKRESQTKASERLARIRQVVAEVIEELRSNEFYNDLGKKVFDAVIAYEMLYCRYGLSHEEITALFALEPLSQWSKLANRLIAEKKKAQE